MGKSLIKHRAFWALALAATVAGCGSSGDKKDDLNAVDARLGGKGKADPALTQALEDQIMVDPNLTQQSNEHSIRPPDEPFQTPIPPDAQPVAPAGAPGDTLGARASEQANAAKAQFTGCALDVSYAPQYANRLPAELPLYPQAQVSEAAGSDSPSCQLRAVTYASVAPPRALTDYYLTLAKRGGYAAHTGQEAGGTLVSGVRARDGAAFYVTLSPAGTGTSADLVSNRGR